MKTFPKVCIIVGSIIVFLASLIIPLILFISPLVNVANNSEDSKITNPSPIINICDKKLDSLNENIRTINEIGARSNSITTQEMLYDQYLDVVFDYYDNCPVVKSEQTCQQKNEALNEKISAINSIGKKTTKKSYQDKLNQRYLQLMMEYNNECI